MKAVAAPETKNQYLSALLANMGAMALGISIGWTSPVQSQLEYDEDGNCSHKFCVTTTEFAWIASCINLGTMIMSPFAGFLMKRIGRKSALVVFLVPAATGWICIITASSPVALYIGRVLIGCSGGSFTAIIPVYVGEISQPDIRGRLSSLFSIFASVGIVYAYVIGYFFSILWLNILCGAVIVGYGIGLVFIPESPRYFVDKNKITKAKDSIKFLRGAEYDADQEIKSIMEARTEQKQKQPGNAYKNLVVDRVNLRSFIILLGLVFAFQMSGINAVLFYTSGILQEANINLDPDVATIIVGCVMILAAFIAATYVDQIGRRPLLLITTVVLALCHILMGGYFLLRENGTTVDSVTWIPIVVLSLFVFTQSLGIGSVVWIMIGEVLDQSVRDIAAGLSIMFSDFLSVVVLLIFPLLSGKIGDGWTFMLFSTFSMISFVFMLVMVPETKGRTLEEIQILLRKQS